MCSVTWIYYKCNCLKGTNEDECEHKQLATKIRTHSNSIVDRFKDPSWAKIFEIAQEGCLLNYQGDREILDYNCCACDSKFTEVALARSETNADESWI